MKISQIIRQKRLEQGLTQEQVAARLGVSAPAVNKWERGVSYPDITLLPPLARLLGTDLNTLLSFREDLTRQEIGEFLNHLSALGTSQGVQAAFDLAGEKLREYPACDLLTLNTAMTLDGLVSMLGSAPEEPAWQQTVEQLYRRAADSSDSGIAHQAKAMLISRHLARQEPAEAQALLDTLPDAPSFDKPQLQASVYTAQGRWEDAAQITEQSLLRNLSIILSTLSTLLDLAMKEGDAQRAEAMATAIQDLSHQFDLWDYNGPAARFRLAVLLQDPEKGIAALDQLITSLEQNWAPGGSPFYCHIPRKESGEQLQALLLPKILKELSDPQHPEYGFLHQSPGFSTLLDRCREGTT